MISVQTNPSKQVSNNTRLAFTNSARTAWGRILAEVCRTNKNVLLPAYIGITDREGSGIFDPIESLDLAYDFYSLNQRLEIDYCSLELQMKSGKFRVMLLVHYFGIEQSNTKRVKQLCDTYGIILIEDCAHVAGLIDTNVTLGGYGDYAFYSLHKSLAVPTGGMLRCNNSELPLPAIPSAEMCEPVVVSELLFTDMEKVRSTRKKHYQRYLEQLKGVEGLTVMYEQIENITPHSFPLVIHGGLREKLYFSLFDLNVPTIALYYRLISNIDPDVYADSYSVSRSILNLPLHQDLDDEQIDYICTSVKQKLRELRV